MLRTIFGCLDETQACLCVSSAATSIWHRGEGAFFQYLGGVNTMSGTGTVMAPTLIVARPGNLHAMSLRILHAIQQ